MGIREALKTLRGGKTGAEEDISETEAPEPTWFQPRYDGVYRAADPASDGLAGATGVTLRFLPGGKVFESTEGLPGPEQHNPCRGDYTAAGRFNVQRQFERIISYAVLEMADGGFAARRINAADRSMAELHFAFEPEINPE